MGRTSTSRTGEPRNEGVLPPAPRRRSVATIVMLIVALMLFLDGIAGERGWLANRRAEAQYQSAVRALEAARERNAALREEARRLREDPAAIEEEARRALCLMKPGEKVFIVKDRTKDARTKGR